MSDSENATLSLGSARAPLEISVVDWTFREVARGSGSVSVSVRPGIYQIACRAGPSLKTSFVTVGPGEDYEDFGLDVRFPSAAPVAGTSTSHEYHQQPVREVSEWIAQRDLPPESAALIVMMRNVPGSRPGGVPSELQLFDEYMEPVQNFPLVRSCEMEGWTSPETDEWAIWAGALVAGGYCLRSQGSEPFDQSIWLSTGWQTLVFIPVTGAVARTEMASVHMAPIGLPWEPGDERTGLALELALWGLRERRSLAPDDLLGLLVNSKWSNPMLGILGAHALVARPMVDVKRLEVIVGNLANLIPGHPDVLGVAARLAEVTEHVSSEVRQMLEAELTWPPMLLGSYEALVRRDGRLPGVVRPQSVADRVSARLVVRGVWTAWSGSLKESPPPRTRRWLKSARASAHITLTARSLARIRDVDPEVQRVCGYLHDLAELGRPRKLGDVADKEGRRRLARSVGLPVPAVERAVDRIAIQLRGWWLW